MYTVLTAEKAVRRDATTSPLMASQYAKVYNKDNSSQGVGPKLCMSQQLGLDSNNMHMLVHTSIALCRETFAKPAPELGMTRTVKSGPGRVDICHSETKSEN